MAINYMGQEFTPGGPAPVQPTPPAKPLTPPAASGGFDMNAMIAAFAQMQQQAAQARLQGQREFLQSQQPIHRGMGGGMIDPTTGKEGGNPFDNRFFRTPSERQQITNTRTQGMPMSVPPTQSNADAAMHASPEPYHITPGWQPQLPQGVPSFEQDQQMAAPGAFSMPGGTQVRRAQPMGMTGQAPMAQPQAQQNYMPQWNASPRPGFGFRARM